MWSMFLFKFDSPLILTLIPCINVIWLLNRWCIVNVAKTKSQRNERKRNETKDNYNYKQSHIETKTLNLNLNPINNFAGCSKGMNLSVCEIPYGFI